MAQRQPTPCSGYDPRTMKTFYVPLHIATTPVTGHCICTQFWIVHPEYGVAFCMDAQEYSDGRLNLPYPQCNTNRRITTTLRNKVYQNHNVLLIPVIYYAHATRIMWEIRQSTTDNL